MLDAHEPRREDQAIWTATAPEAVFTVRAQVIWRDDEPRLVRESASLCLQNVQVTALDLSETATGWQSEVAGAGRCAAARSSAAGSYLHSRACQRLRNALAAVIGVVIVISLRDVCGLGSQSGRMRRIPEPSESGAEVRAGHGREDLLLVVHRPAAVGGHIGRVVS